MPKWIKTIIAILLLPVCIGAAMALWKVLTACGSADTTWVPLLAGAACWVVIYYMLPKPMWIYVFGHELTHALWVWVCGGNVKQFKATSDGGHIIADKTNFRLAHKLRCSTRRGIGVPLRHSITPCDAAHCPIVTEVTAETLGR